MCLLYYLFTVLIIKTFLNSFLCFSPCSLLNSQHLLRILKKHIVIIKPINFKKKSKHSFNVPNFNSIAAVEVKIQLFTKSEAKPPPFSPFKVRGHIFKVKRLDKNSNIKVFIHSCTHTGRGKQTVLKNQIGQDLFNKYKQLFLNWGKKFPYL